jgi:hypothetical protein
VATDADVTVFDCRPRRLRGRLGSVIGAIFVVLLHELLDAPLAKGMASAGSW